MLFYFVPSTALPAASTVTRSVSPPAVPLLKLMIHAVFAGAQVDVTECGGLCSYYAELGGLMVGFEDADA